MPDEDTAAAERQHRRDLIELTRVYPFTTPLPAESGPIANPLSALSRILAP